MMISTINKKVWECVDIIEAKAGIKIAKKFIKDNLNGSITLEQNKKYNVVIFCTRRVGSYFQPMIRIQEIKFDHTTSDFIVSKDNLRIKKENCICVIYR